VGWPGFIEASIFITVLLAALIYLIRIGALELTRRHQPFRATQLKRLQQVENQPVEQSFFDQTIFDQTKGQQ